MQKHEFLSLEYHSAPADVAEGSALGGGVITCELQTCIIFVILSFPCTSRITENLTPTCAPSRFKWLDGSLSTRIAVSPLRN